MPEPKSVLVIDDSANDLYIARRRLRKHWPNVEILEASDGLEAIQILNGAAHLPELIFLDINMPRMGGHEFLERWFGDRDTAIPVVVMLSSYRQEEDVDRTGSFECVQKYFIKPMSAEDLAGLEGFSSSEEAA